MTKTHPADELVQSAHQTVPKADEYLIDAVPTGALIKADNPKLVLEALKDGKVRMTCSTWEDARGSPPAKCWGCAARAPSGWSATLWG